ncbi:LapA family protein [Parathalassolituus penaei]|uniref:LapA family protein n=1 Tax=Parathalassolituus penaei TaxID=2997323 RepID=A0A9X3EEM2_9GAMM|nr:LapA family protein [Parathalassolituus penaei]MCY0965816.1 LapA family protein [Parathalassolituus penaei]
MLRKIRIFVSLVSFVLLLVYCLAFAARNSTVVPVDFLVGQPSELPLAMWLGVAVMLGCLLGVIAGVASGFRKNREIRRLQKQLAAATAPVSKPVAAVAKSQ